MAKFRKVLGSVVKNKEKASTYIKVYGDHTLKDGQFLNLENKKDQLKSLEQAMQAGKISEENAEKARERIERIPDFVLFEVTTYEEKK